MKVKATKQGYFGGGRRNPGDTFEMPNVTVKAGEVIGKNGKAVSWVVPASGEGTSGPKARGATVIETPKTNGSTSPDEQDGDGEQ
ncbi:hypothetical protein [Paraburkholderia unamae]|uniref:Uncharacterized protein n=1 Tax=Paraburkholderia unamae TaxID=219649 RepID=A0ABX5KPD6_9BURK|nr:hypothetical protein [Paraburkholderia unamae]PVX84348.1 hypothetical protein C7402_105189 [Paraburkholderia unamae]